jgi:hypothetical protein
VVGKITAVVINYTPSSGQTYLIADRTYPTDRGETAARCQLWKSSAYDFDGLSTVRCSVPPMSPVLRVERGDCGRVVPGAVSPSSFA